MSHRKRVLAEGHTEVGRLVGFRWPLSDRVLDTGQVEMVYYTATKDSATKDSATKDSATKDSPF